MMKRKVLLVYPEVPVTYWSYTHTLKYTGRKALMAPLGILTIAAMFPPNYSLTLVDMNVDELKKSQVEDADLVLISAMIVQKESFDKVVALCKECAVPVAAGGPYPTTSYENIEGVDYFILNEGEVTFPRFLAEYENGTAKHIYQDETKPDLSLTPLARFDLIDIKKYGTIPLQNSRGCPFSCEFCDIIEMFGRKPRYKEPSKFVRELEFVLSLGHDDSIFIVDDNFIGNKGKVKLLLHEIIAFQKKHDYPFSFITEASIDLASDDELLELMVEANFEKVFIGLETPDTEILAGAKKSQNTRGDLFSSVAKIQRTGIEVMAGFILGFDNEGEDIFERQIEFIQRAGIPVAMIGLMMALPKTQLHRRLEKEGRMRNLSSGNNTHQLDLNFVPTMDKARLVKGYVDVLSTLYNPKVYFQRCKNNLALSDKLERGGGAINLGSILLFLHTFFVQTFSSYGLVYLEYLITTLRKYPDRLYLIVSFAVRGIHFFKITEEIKRIYRCKVKMEKYLGNLEEKLKKIEVTQDKKLLAAKVSEYQKWIGKKLDSVVHRQPESLKHHIRQYHVEYCKLADALFVQYTQARQV